MQKYLSLLIFTVLLFPGFTKKPAAARARDYSLFFAVEHYEDKGLHELHYPVKNATDIKNELENTYGFEHSEIVRDPTYEQIERKLREYKENFRTGAFDAGGQLFIFFSGHGARDEEGNGFFLPRDTKTDDLKRTAFSYALWRGSIDRIPCKHIFVAIDACNSGSFDPATEMKGDEDPYMKRVNEPTDRDVLMKRAESLSTRFFATSGALNISTPDNSSFAKQILAALRSGGNLGGVNDNILTWKELGTFFESANPQPMAGNFGAHEAAANFIFVVKNNKPDPVPVATDRITWQNALSQNTSGAYQNYIRQFPNGDFAAEAKDKIRQSEQQAEDVDWAYAKSRKTSDAYQSFLNSHPNSVYASAAKRFIDETSFSFKPATASVTGGFFQMGQSDPDIGGAGKSKNEQPPHSVRIGDFTMGKYEVTVAQFKAFIDDDGYKTDADKEGWSYVWSGTKYEKMNGANWKCGVKGEIRPATEYNHPVIHVSWNDADAYCKWLSRKTGQNYRLPTEAEWEYAAGNGARHTKFSWGNGDPAGKDGGNVADEDSKTEYNWAPIFDNYHDGYANTAPVGQYNPNDLGLYDMTGNVWEWCSDWYDEKYYASSPSQNPVGAATGSGRVIRGGSWGSDPQDCRVSYRYNYAPASRDSYVGFRVASGLQ